MRIDDLSPQTEQTRQQLIQAIQEFNQQGVEPERKTRLAADIGDMFSYLCTLLQVLGKRLVVDELEAAYRISGIDPDFKGLIALLRKRDKQGNMHSED